MKQKGREKHNQIVTAAAALFAQHGYKKTTIDEIVAKASVSKGLFYHYFKNKQELYSYLYHSYVRILSTNISEKVDLCERDFFQRLKQIMYIRIDFIKLYPELWNFLYSAYYEEHPDVASLIQGQNRKLLMDSYTGSAENIDWSKLKKGLSPDNAIELITWVAEGFVRKVANNPIHNEALYYQFDEYLEYLRTGMYEDR